MVVLLSTCPEAAAELEGGAGRRPEEGGNERGEEKGQDGEKDKKEREHSATERVFVRACVCSTHLRCVNPPLLEGTAGRVMGTQVAILAPVAAEGTVHT